ncbi:M20/M25/M40 family metallo-hydrolase [Croceicoccus naphthovorans]|uniref:Peptidase M20 n=1 Tax=Croceicoccus naphthovorans TaxID=1348774 RepID=A0A0G3XIC5_9SPHN|nr:M20/M25/M40 family metallo-hydrolase [Croceicoccus naphthovorans]AKM10364.1 peptidase M20 [Croceicoccus naphthovorans]MBB3990057.1 acetylornithine deacetylase/succinyl-diaminopimelate desuccinylase-like protein [Croceicoccus naphthovorans]
MVRMPVLAPLLMAATALGATPALAADDDGWSSFRELYQALVETDTTLSNGSCTKAAKLAANHLAEAGMARENLHLITVPEHPEEGSLVAVYPGSDPDGGAILLLAHLDVVEAKPEDWERDPFTLIEEDGWFYARGAADAKSLAAVWTDTLARFARDRHTPGRTVKVALTCGEETNGAYNGAEWLAANRRDLIDADFALNEGGGGFATDDGLVLTQRVQVGEKIFANYELEVRNAGGHSSAPRPDNAIYELASALKAIEAYDFPVEFSDVTRASLQQRAESEKGELGAAISALLADPGDADADAVVSADANLRSNTRTTCVATMLEAGHARNALPQRATANVNCRIFPGHPIEEIRKALVTAIGDERVSVKTLDPIRPAPPPPPLSDDVIEPMKEMVGEHFPWASFGVTMSNGYTDSTFLTAAGIPAYGTPGPWSTGEPSGVHGLNERIRVDALKQGRAFLYDLIRAYTD